MDYNDELIVLNLQSLQVVRVMAESFNWGKGSEEFNLATMSEDEIVNDRIAEDTGRTCKIVK